MVLGRTFARERESYRSTDAKAWCPSGGLLTHPEKKLAHQRFRTAGIGAATSDARGIRRSFSMSSGPSKALRTSCEHTLIMIHFICIHT